MASTIYKRQERLLTVKDLSLEYHGNQVFRDINIHIDNVIRPNIEQGQIICLLGPSGTGKTQLFRCLAGLNKPTTGQVSYFNNGIPVKAGQVGVVFQSYPLLKHRTIKSNLELVADKQHVIEYLTAFHLENKLNAYPAQLSGGQRQRVAIIQQILCSSYFILMDEPFSGLDVVMKRRAMDIILKLSLTHEHYTFIITTHDVNTAVALADTIWILGRQQGCTKNTFVPGSTIIKEIDLIERDLAWSKDVYKQPQYYPTVLEINELFNYI